MNRIHWLIQLERPEVERISGVVWSRVSHFQEGSGSISVMCWFILRWTFSTIAKMAPVSSSFILHWKEQKHLFPQIHFDWSGLDHMPILKPITEVKGLEYTNWLSLVHMLHPQSWGWSQFPPNDIVLQMGIESCWEEGNWMQGGNRKCSTQNQNCVVVHLNNSHWAPVKDNIGPWDRAMNLTQSQLSSEAESIISWEHKLSEGGDFFPFLFTCISSEPRTTPGT